MTHSSSTRTGSSSVSAAPFPMPSVCVYLIGAGPGDPGLITVRAAELLQRAQVVVYDYLANDGLLNYAPESAEKIFVGKQGYTSHVTQDEINSLLVDKAHELMRCHDQNRRGADSLSKVSSARRPAGAATQVIVRLKGGDPFVFGRGGEEALALKASGIPFEVVPGITSGIAAPAYAGIPVTHRGLSTSVTFVTGNEDPGKADSQICWDGLAQLARNGSTLCFYMGVRNLTAIADNLLSRGVDPVLTVALVQQGTTLEQKSLLTTLARAAKDAADAGIRAPAIIVVGSVAALHSDLSWFEARPLSGMQVLVTRSRAQASVLSATLRELGAQAREFSTICQTAPDSYQDLDQALTQLARFDWLVFTSAQGVHAFFDRLSWLAGQGQLTGLADARSLSHARVAAIGPATKAALRSYGIVADVMPDSYVAEEVAAALSGCCPDGLAGTRILIPRAQVAREELPRLLREAGAEVLVAAAYKTLPPATDAGAVKKLLDQLSHHELDALTFTSSSTVSNLVDILDATVAGAGPGREAAASSSAGAGLLRKSGALICSIGPITSATLRSYGLHVDIEAKEYTVDGLVEAICAQRCQQDPAG